MKTPIIGENVCIYGLSSWNGENPGGIRYAEGTQKNHLCKTDTINFFYKTLKEHTKLIHLRNFLCFFFQVNIVTH